MLSRTLLREHPDVLRANFERRRTPERVADVDRLLQLDAEARQLIARSEELRHELKTRSQAIGQAIRDGGDAEAAKESVRAVKAEADDVEARRRATEKRRDELEATFPNVLLDDVPDGESEADNVVVRTWGEPPSFDFEPRAHDEIGQALGILDFERGAKVAGARFTFVRGPGARLAHALVAFMRTVHAEAGDEELLPPLLVNEATLFGTGQLPKFEQDLFRVDADPPLYLIPTAEVPVTNFHADEILDADELPLRYFAFSPCFRSEAGSHGKDVRGYIRQHHFDKVELVRFTTPEQSVEEWEAMTRRAEEILERLELPHRTVRLCSADTGFQSAATNDVEVWLPSQGTYREISSCSTCTDFQARRARIRFRREPGAKPEVAHTLNGSGLAVGRTLVALLENFQRADGGVTIPDALRSHFGADSIEPR